MGYLKNAAGEVPLPHEREGFRRTSRGVINGFVAAGNPPGKWSSDATDEQRAEYRLKMESAHDIFRLCDGGWKAEAFAVMHYPQVKLTHQRRFEKDVKQGRLQASDCPKWLQTDKKGKGAADEGTVDPTTPSESGRKRKSDPKAVLAEAAHKPKRRELLGAVNPM